MAGFLRKKIRQDPQPAKQLPATPPTPSMTPLFARFSTTATTSQEPPRLVSSPMLLSSARKDTAGHSHNNHHRGLTSRNVAAVHAQRDGDIKSQRSVRTPGKGRDISSEQEVSYGVPLSPQSSPTRTRARPVSQAPMLDKPLPPSFQPNPSSYNLPPTQAPPHHARTPSPEHPSPIQGEYAHLWSIIAGDSFKLPESPEPTIVVEPTHDFRHTATDQETKRLAEPQHAMFETSNISSPAEPAVTTPQTHVGLKGLPEPPPGARRPTPPNASSLTNPNISNESSNGFQAHAPIPRSSQKSLSRHASFIDANTSRSSLGAPAGWTTLSSEVRYDGGRPSDVVAGTQADKHKNDLRNSMIPDFSQSEVSLSLSPTSSPKTSRKLSKAKPVGQSTTSNPKTSAANRFSFVPSSVQDRTEPPKSSRNPTPDVMGNNPSTPFKAPEMQQLPKRAPSQNFPTNRQSITPVHPNPVPQQRMSVSYAPNANTLQRSASVIPAATVALLPGKPLIFTAMTAVQETPQVSPPPPPAHHKNENVRSVQASPPLPPQHSFSQQVPASVPMRRESLHPQHNPPRPPPVTLNNNVGQVNVQQHPPYALQPPAAPAKQPLPPPKDIHPANLNGSLPPLPARDAVAASPQPAARLRRPPSKSRPSQTSVDLLPAPTTTLSHMRTSSVVPHNRSPVKGHHPAKASISPGKAGPIQIDGDDVLGVPLDDDPFAKVEGVKMLKAVSRAGSPSDGSGGVGGGGGGKRSKSVDDRKGLLGGEDQFFSDSGSHGEIVSNNSTPQLSVLQDREVDVASELLTVAPPVIGATDGAQDLLTGFLSDSRLLSFLIDYLQFYDWCTILSLSREIRFMIVQRPVLREVVLERFLKPVGYARWGWNEQEPLSLSLQDLNDYMRGVSTPTHEYSRVAALYVHSLSIHPAHRDQSLYDTVHHLAASTRAYTRVILRLRAQAEKEAAVARLRGPSNMRTGSRPPSRAPSPTFSQSNHGHAAAVQQQKVSGVGVGVGGEVLPSFQSPLFRIKRAPLLRVFVPSPEGDWLSDKSVLECETECRRAGVMHLMRMGDVVWDVAVGDEGNMGRLVWDGSFLLDLDYTYSPIGDLPKYMPTFAFPPSYFHRVIRAGPNSSNPIVHIDVRPWGEEIAGNLQLLQERVRTETPQGAHHNLVRWVHRSAFVIRPLGRGASRSPGQYNRTTPTITSSRIPIPDTNNLFVDPGWYGTIVVETEGTNESLADLQDRCGRGAFPPRPPGVNGHRSLDADREGKLVFCVLREKSRPGEIWIRTVSPKERLL